MQRFCGQCGSALDETANGTGFCPACGAPLDVDNTVTNAGNSPRTSTPGDDDGALTEPMAAGPASLVRTSVPLGRTALLAAGGIVALLLVALIALVAARGAPRQGHRDPAISATHTPSAGSPTETRGTATPASPTSPAPSAPVDTASPTGTATATDTPIATDTPVATGTPIAIGTPTAISLSPRLSVQPMKIDIAVCLGGAKTQFTVANTGGGSLTWSATASDATYTLAPSSGTVNGGSQDTVMVSGISGSGTITIDAPGAQNAPQQVTITCLA